MFIPKKEIDFGKAVRNMLNCLPMQNFLWLKGKYINIHTYITIYVYMNQDLWSQKHHKDYLVERTIRNIFTKKEILHVPTFVENG